jgi:hypothetical protein
MTETGTLRKSDAERKAQLDAALQQAGARGWRIENRSDFQATIAHGKEVSHLLHFFLTLITLGIWLIAWFGLGLFGGVKRQLLTVDEYGNVVAQKL